MYIWTRVSEIEISKRLKKWFSLGHFNNVTRSHPTQMLRHVMWRCHHSEWHCQLHTASQTQLIFAKIQVGNLESTPPPLPPHTQTKKKNSLDLASSDYFLIPKLKETLIWKSDFFNSCRELAQWTGTWFLPIWVKQMGPTFR